MRIKQIPIEARNNEQTPLLYLGTTPMMDRIGQPTSILFVSPRMTYGGLYNGVNPDNASIEELVNPLVGTIDESIDPQNKEYLRVCVDPTNREGLWDPVIDALREHYKN